MGKSGAGSRTATLSCLDFSNVWDTNYSYILQYGVSDGAGGGAIVNNMSKFMASVSNTSHSSFDNIVSDPAMVIRRYSQQNPLTQGISGTGSCLGGLLTILELLSGVQGLYFGINSWATVTERRTKVLDSVVSDSGEIARKLYDTQVFADWLQNKTGHAGSVISFREIVDKILEYIYYDFVPNPVAGYLRGDDGNGNPGREVPDWKNIIVSTGGQKSSDKFVKEFRKNNPEFSWKGWQKNLINLSPTFLNAVEKFYEKAKEDLKAVGLESYSIMPISAFRSVETRLQMGYPTTGYKTMKVGGKKRAVGVEKKNGRWVSTGKPMTKEQAQQFSMRFAHDNGFALDFMPGGGIAFNGPEAIDFAGKSPHGKPLSAGYARKTKRVATKIRYTLYWYTVSKGGGGDVLKAKGGFVSKAKKGGTRVKGLGELDAVFDYIIAQAAKGSGDIRVLATIWQNELVKTWKGAVAITDTDFAQRLKEHYKTILRPAMEKEALWWKTVGKAARATGMSWGGTYKPVDPYFYAIGGAEMEGWDPMHIQLKNWKSVLKKEAQTGKVYAPAKKKTKKGKQPKVREKLRSFIFRPNIWPAAPPVCNVMFPDDVEAFQFNRQMMRETTRLKLDSYNQFFESVVVNKYYYAPQFTEGESLEKGGIGSVSKAVIYDHERFSGIIPKIEKISELSFYAKQDKTGKVPLMVRSGAGKNAINTAKSSEAASTLQTYGKQVAHYNLLTHRYEARTASFSARFLPRLVCGFPALIVDQALLDSERYSQNSKKTNRPNWNKVHWLGMIDTLTHSIDQSGARSSGQLRYVRSHRTGDETDDLFSENITNQGEFITQDPDLLEIEHSAIEFKIDAAAMWSIDSVAPSDAWLFHKVVEKTIPKQATVGLLSLIYNKQAVVSMVGKEVQEGQYFATRRVAATTVRRTHSDEKNRVGQALKEVTGTKVMINKKGQQMESGEWSGPPTPIVVRWELSKDPNDWTSFPVEDANLPLIGEKHWNPKRSISLKGTQGAILKRQIFSLDKSTLLTDDQKKDIKTHVGRTYRVYETGTADTGKTKTWTLPASADYKPEVPEIRGVSYRDGASYIKQAYKPQVGTAPEIIEKNVVVDTTVSIEQVYWLPGDSFIAKFAPAMTKGGNRRIPLEEAIMPPWVSDEYKNAEIGEKIYGIILGCDSIMRFIPSGAKPYDNLSNHSVEQAVDTLVSQFSQYTSSGRDIAWDWIYHSTKRPVANFNDILLPKGVYQSASGAVTELSASEKKDKVKMFFSGGFHSAAVCGTSYSKKSSTHYGFSLEYLDIVNVKMASRMNTSKKAVIDKSEATHLDPRGERARRIIKYRNSISGSNALKSLGSRNVHQVTKFEIGIGKKG